MLARINVLLSDIKALQNGSFDKMISDKRTFDDVVKELYKSANEEIRDAEKKLLQPFEQKFAK